jgi:putative nucleotidyltransferase with HDIG domain
VEAELSTGNRRSILIVDDEESIRRLLETSLEQRGYQTCLASSAHDALRELSSNSYDLVLSDLRMPAMSGLELLEAIGARHQDVGVLLLTGCNDVTLAVAAMQMGALDYVLKPFRLDQIADAIRRALERHDRELLQKRHVSHLEEVLRAQTLELRSTFEHLQDMSAAALEALVAALDVREHETQEHSKRVSEYSLHLARAMGVDPSLMLDIARGALLHDIGKIGISDNILLKAGRLTPAEWDEMRKHPGVGHWIVGGLQVLRESAEIVLAHQEKFDGSGYPRGLRGEEIPLGARIFSVVDCYDAITSDRPYRKARDYAAARDEIVRCSGTQFDPRIVEYFLLIPPGDWMEIRRRVSPGPGSVNIPKGIPGNGNSIQPHQADQ